MFGVVMRQPRLVNIIWDDGWLSIGQDITPHINSTIGWLVGETEAVFYVSSTIADQRDRHMGCIGIEKAQVVQVIDVDIPLGEYNEVLSDDEDEMDIEVELEDPSSETVN